MNARSTTPQGEKGARGTGAPAARLPGGRQQRQQWQLAALVFVLAMAVSATIVWLAERERIRSLRAEALHLAQSHAQTVERNVVRMTSINHALAALVRQGGGQVQNFDVAAGELLQIYPGLLALSLSPGGVVRHVVPLERNRALLGFNQLDDALQRGEARLTRDSARLTLAGPLQLAQGDVGVVARLPIFLHGDDGMPRFWGFSNVSMRLAELLHGTGLDSLPERGFDYRLWRVQNDTGQRAVIAASTEREPDAPARQSLEVPNGAWNLDIVPVEGWRNLRWLATAGAAGLALSLLLAHLAALMLAQRQQRTVLEALVQQRTAQIAATRNQLHSTLQAMPDPLFELGQDGTIHSAHLQADVYGPDMAQALVGRNIAEVLMPGHLVSVQQALQEAQRSGHARGTEHAVRVRGQERWYELSLSRKEVLPGEPPRFVAVARDITETRAARQEVRRLAFYDPLTDLPNRRLLQDRLEHALKAALRSGHFGALLLIDMDNFKALNDTMGHDKGDLLLREVAARLLNTLRSHDTVARLGGDEFVVLVDDMGAERQQAILHATTVAEKIVRSLSEPYDIAGHAHRSSTSIGVSLFGADTASAEETLKRSDVAMYQAKAAGRNTLRFFDPAMQAAVEARATMEADIRQGLASGEFSLHYQPQVRTGGQVVGAEALARWEHPRHGRVAPAEFIPVAETSDLILELGAWVLREACTRLRAWAGDPALAGLSLAVNVSVRQFRQSGFVAQVLEVLATTGAPPERLKLEITESMFASDLEEMIHKMEALRAAGVHFALDDFGTGYSSLSYLKRLPLDQLKIDQSFVRDVMTDANDAAIARTIVALARSLGLDVIAEGVETPAEREFLYAHGCHTCQGYLFSPPLPEAAFHAYVAHAPQNDTLLML